MKSILVLGVLMACRLAFAGPPDGYPGAIHMTITSGTITQPAFTGDVSGTYLLQWGDTTYLNAGAYRAVLPGGAELIAVPTTVPYDAGFWTEIYSSGAHQELVYGAIYGSFLPDGSITFPGSNWSNVWDESVWAGSIGGHAPEPATLLMGLPLGLLLFRRKA